MGCLRAFLYLNLLLLFSVSSHRDILLNFLYLGNTVLMAHTPQMFYLVKLYFVNNNVIAAVVQALNITPSVLKLFTPLKYCNVFRFDTPSSLLIY